MTVRRRSSLHHVTVKGGRRLTGVSTAHPPPRLRRSVAPLRTSYSVA